MLKKILILVLFIGLCNTLHAEELEKDSLTYFLEKIKNDKIVVSLNLPILENLENISSLFFHIEEKKNN
jgi:hypothetical protein